MPSNAEAEDSLTSPEQSPRFPALSIARMLWNRRWLVLSFWVIGSSLAFGIIVLLPSVYRAEAVIVVDSQKIPESFVTATVSGDVADRLALITQSIMTSDRLLDTVHKFDLYRKERSRLTQEELLRKMRDDISVSFEKNWTGNATKAF